MQITKVRCPQNKIAIKCPYSMNAEYIIVHNTANDASAMSEVSYMLGNSRYTSFHYAVDDYRIVQGIEENRNTYNAGDGINGRGNRKGIAIEICYSRSGGERFDKAERLAAKFIAHKLKEKGWGMDRVKKHQDFSGKYCPHRTLDLGWERFLNLIRQELGVNNPVVNAPQNELYKVKITTDVLRVRSIPSTSGAITTRVRKGEIYTIVEESNGWGKLKSGAGWISLAYTSKNLQASRPNPQVSRPKGFHKGQKVVLQRHATHYATGQRIPSRFLGKVYTVQQVANGKCLLKELYSWVLNQDIK